MRFKRLRYKRKGLRKIMSYVLGFVGIFLGIIMIPIPSLLLYILETSDPKVEVALLIIGMVIGSSIILLSFKKLGIRI